MDKHKTFFDLLPLDDPQPSLYPWLWTGTWSMGGHGWGKVDARESIKTLQHAFANGIRHFDTAGLYAKGESERLLRKALAKQRKKIFISSKAGLKWHGNMVIHDASPESIKKELEQSLARLNTDYIDLFQLHWPDPNVPIRESIGMLKELADNGPVRKWGAGNLTVQQLNEITRSGSMMPHQVHFNPLSREKTDVLEAGHADNRAVNCITSPLEQGLLGSGSGKYGLHGLGKRDHRHRNPAFHDSLKIAKAKHINMLCKQRQCSIVTAVLWWILSQNQTDIVIVGPKNRRQLEEAMEHASMIYNNMKSQSLQQICRELLYEHAGQEVIDAMCDDFVKILN